MAASWENLSAGELADQGWRWEQFEELAFYVKDNLLGDMIPFGDFRKVENRPCDVMRATLHHQPYNVYRYREHTLFVPENLGEDFDDVIDFGANEYGLTYSVISKHQDTLENTVYSFGSTNKPEDEVKFTKVLIQAPVNNEAFKEEFYKAGSKELFFTGKRYSKFFERNPETTRKVVEIIKTPTETKAFCEDATNIRASLDRLLNGEREYTPVANPDAPLFEIIDSYDIHNVK